MTRVEITHPARDDLEAIWAYIARDSAESADRLVDRIHELCLLYASQPEAGTRADHFGPGLRYFSAGNYVVFFRHESDSLLVIRVLHGARHIDDLFRD
jgi:toxin ParE1/3/4